MCFTDESIRGNLIVKYARFQILIQQLVVSFKQFRRTDRKRIDQEELDMKCLQLLRGLVHNAERQLPPIWTNDKDPKVKKYLQQILDMQNLLNTFDALPNILPHVSRNHDGIIREILCFICAMLFNANKESQKDMLDFFLFTREESFFFSIKKRMQISANAIKEKRSLAQQRKAKTDDSSLIQMKSMQETINVGRMLLQVKEVYFFPEQNHGNHVKSTTAYPLSNLNWLILEM